MKREFDAAAEAARHTALEVRADYERRSEMRRATEAQWTLNACFVAGRQFAEVTPVLGIDDAPPDREWSERQAYNHIAPILETRLAKLAGVRPVMSVRPASGSDEDFKTAEVSTKILSAVSARLETENVISRATLWSELTGTALYKVFWDKKTRDVCVTAVSPYEIFPDNLCAETMDDVRSLIHARALPVCEIADMYGVLPAAEEVEFAYPERGSSRMLSDMRRIRPDGYAVLIERYERPSADKPDGELLITCGEHLLWSGPLPYTNGTDGSRTFPFVKQDALPSAGMFFGQSMVERAIPLQRAYNAVKNRKHELINRLCGGVLVVEDGSVDTEELEAEGLRPGSVVVYRRGSSPPSMLEQGGVPSALSAEELRLEEEFNVITGVSDIMRSSAVPANANSGTAIQLLIDQDDSRLAITSDLIRSAVREVSRMVLRLYKQFASGERLTRCVGEDGKVELVVWKGSDIGECDVVCDTVAESAAGRAGKQSRLLELLSLGLLSDDNGRLSSATRHKLLDAFGYGSWETAEELRSLHEQKADEENIAAAKGDVREPSEIDDHDVHIRSHVRFMLSGDFAEAKKRHKTLESDMLAHVRAHRTMKALEARTEAKNA